MYYRESNVIVSNDVENSREPKADPSSGSIDLTLGNDPRTDFTRHLRHNNTMHLKGRRR